MEASTTVGVFLLLNQSCWLLLAGRGGLSAVAKKRRAAIKIYQVKNIRELVRIMPRADYLRVESAEWVNKKLIVRCI